MSRFESIAIRELLIPTRIEQINPIPKNHALLHEAPFAFIIDNKAPPLAANKVATSHLNIDEM
jgi:hypothetical protein